MFENIGGKIKRIAEIETWIGIILSIMFGLSMMSNEGEYVFLGLFIIVFGSLISWTTSLLIYGFGQLIDNTDKLVAQSKIPTSIESEIDSEAQKRMEQLDDLRRDGLITEKEYQQKLNDIKKG